MGTLFFQVEVLPKFEDKARVANQDGVQEQHQQEVT